MARSGKKSTRPQRPLKAAPASTGNARGWVVPLVCVALAAITLAVFGQTVRHQFVNLDDKVYVYGNPVVCRGLTLKGAAWAFSSIKANNWHPLTWLSHMADCQMYDVRPGGHHFTSVALHIATVILLFLVLRRMTGALWPSAFVAAVFAIHPLRVESVAWVAERKDVLSGLFFVLTVGAYARYVQQGRTKGLYALVVLCFALGLLAKPMLVTLPLVLLLLDYWPLRRTESLGRLALEKLPLLALSAASCIVTVFAQKDAIQSTQTFTLPLRLGNALAACAIYLRQMMWPAGLAVAYPYPRDGLPSWQLAVAAILLIGLSAIAIWQRQKRPWLLTGWLWYLVMLVPVAGIVQVGMQPHADRYTYLPQIGLCIAVAWLAAEWPWRRAVFGAAMCGIVAALAAVAWKQTGYWCDSETLWTRALACDTNNPAAHFGFGNLKIEEGQIDDGISHLQTAARLDPTYVEPRINLGNAFLQSGRIPEAIDSFQSALKIDPGSFAACAGLGTTVLQQGKTNEAIALYQQALKLNPGYDMALNNLGNLYLQAGNLDEATSCFQRAMAANPNLAGTHFSLGNILQQKNRTTDAIAQYQTALQIDPNYTRARVSLGNTLLQSGNSAEAITQFHQVLQLDSANLPALNNLAWLLATATNTSLRNGNKAVELARQASSLTGGRNPVILQTLAAALAETGQFADAIQTAKSALELARAYGEQNLIDDLNGELKNYEAAQRLPSPP